MLSLLTTPAKAFYQSYPILAQVFLTTATCLLTTFLILREVFKPIGKKRLQTGQRPRLPPGPRGTPLWGNYELLRKAQLDRNNALVLPITPTTVFPAAGPLLIFSQQLKRLPSDYGEMTTMHIGQKTFIFLNTNRVVTELISKRSRLTSSRSPYPIASSLISLGARSLLLAEEEWWPRRKIQNSLLGNLKQYSAVQELESAQMLAEYVFRPGEWYRHHFRFANSVIHRVALGERPTKSREELEELQAVVHGYIATLHVGSTYVDWFPSVATVLPKALHSLWVKRGGSKYRRLADWTHSVYHAWYDPVRDSVLAGTAPPSFVRDTLLHPDGKFSGTDDDACYVAMQLIEGGSDTTTSVLRNLVRAAIEQPAPFRRAREEVDRACGMRLPTLDDMDSLRYICALVKEVLRWKPLFVSFPEHTSTADIEFEGYLFPAGVSFVPNGAAVCAECEGESDEFRPERWLDGHETDITHGLWQFGGGRRICVGYRLAQRSLFLAAARLVQCIDFEKREGDEAMRHGLKHHDGIDEPFPVKATIRGEEYRKLILNEAQRLGVLEDAKG